MEIKSKGNGTFLLLADGQMVLRVGILGRRNRNQKSVAEHNELGKLGEEVAVRYLLHHDYHIMERDWRCGHSDVDIIAEKRGQVVFVEVKTLASDLYGSPLQHVTPEKVRRLQRSANAYVQGKDLAFPVRFDIITVVGTAPNFHVKHYPSVFGMAARCVEGHLQIE